MGIGNTLRGDDATGPKIIDQIYERYKNIQTTPNANISTIDEP